MNLNSHFTKEELEKVKIAHLAIGTLKTRIAMSEASDKKDKKDLEKSNAVFKQIQKGVEVYKLFYTSGLCKSFGESKRLIKQGGLYVNRKCVKDPYQVFTIKDAIDNSILLQKGKKHFCKISFRKEQIQSF